ncbi:MAG TPA: tRNA pseudouridine(55) synthase TruB [Methyloceanibacter sp.]|nr:tRNA pseudouridine(55) synthase TruB [Methyloceanibacter sp.]
MARRRKGQAVSGWLILDKPEGMTSTRAVGRVRWLYDAVKAGHAGTLDPLATGILPIAFGEATKTVPFAVEGRKAYRFTVRFGAETDTDDTEGKVTETSDRRPTAAEIEAVLPQFTGAISQVPPRYSALKVEGARAYDLARNEEEFELAPRIVTVDRLRLVDLPDPDHGVLEAECGKGTYVRALARDLGRALGCLGHVSALRRTRVGSFTEAEAVTLEEVEAAAQESREAALPLLRPVETALQDLPALNLSSADAARLRQGQAVLLRGRDAPIMTGPVYAVSKGALVALGEVAQGEFRPRRIFNPKG